RVLAVHLSAGEPARAWLGGAARSSACCAVVARRPDPGGGERGRGASGARRDRGAGGPPLGRAGGLPGCAMVCGRGGGRAGTDYEGLYDGGTTHGEHTVPEHLRERRGAG